MTSTRSGLQEPIIADEDDYPELQQLGRLLGDLPANTPVSIGPASGQINLPDPVARLLPRIVMALLEGDAVALASVPEELTTQQAADLLNVSRPHLIELLERGEIPFHKTGTHRRIRFGDLIAHRDQQAQRRRRALADLTQLSEELDLYES